MKTTILFICTLLISSFTLIAAEAPKSESMILETLLITTQDNDLIKFESVCDDGMKEAIKEEDLKQVSAQLSALMKQGYKKVYMGMLDRGAFNTYLWKIDFDKDGVPEMLAELSTSNNKVVGFYIR